MKEIVSCHYKKYTYQEMARDIAVLCRTYPTRCRTAVIGHSEDGRKLFDVIVGNPEAAECVLVVAALHGREYMTSLLCMKQIEYYLQHYLGKMGGFVVKDILDTVAIHYIPMANPDGVSIAQYGIRTIRNPSLRKAFRCICTGKTSRWKANARGVDLNRNFPFAFQVIGKRGKEGYSGPAEACEKETKALVSLIHYLKTLNIKGVINYHASGAVVFGDCIRTGALADRTGKMTELACRITGYPEADSGDSVIMGNLREYLLYDRNIPNITVEIGRRECPLPISEFPLIWKENKSLVLCEAGELIKNG